MKVRLLNKLNHGQKGITGLETAIILIAFVVVAAVFAYTVLSAGLFSTQKSQEAVYSGLKQTQSTLELRGGVIAYGSSGTGASVLDSVDRSDGSTPLTSYSSTAPNFVTRVSFTVAGVLGGEPIDLSPPWTTTTVDPPSDIAASSPDRHITIISYDDEYNHFADCEWTRAFVGYDDGDNLLEQDEKATITVWLVEHNGTDFNLGSTNGTFFDDADDTAGYLPDANHNFTLQVKTGEGAVLVMERTLPAYIDAANDLY
ncbi:MAG: hypothetical protein FJZ95_08695 [Chloroflexi bacterium]|nr:hypothetical protein [Chloroflexota bacterium]